MFITFMMDTSRRNLIQQQNLKIALTVKGQGGRHKRRTHLPD